MELPKDDYILLSAVNMKLRDGYDSFEDFCTAENVDGAEIGKRLAALGYAYDGERNAFVCK